LRLASFVFAMSAISLFGSVLIGPGSAVASTPGNGIVPIPAIASPIETVVVFSHPVELDSLAIYLAKLNVTPISFSHVTKSGNVGGNVSHGLPLGEVIDKYRSNYHYMVNKGEPQIWRLSLEGAAPNVTLSSLGVENASITRSSGRVRNLSFATPLPNKNSAVLPAAGPTLTAPPVLSKSKKWAPNTGRVSTAAVSNAPGSRRLIKQTISWSDQASIDDFGTTAYEHDFKLI
jgi:hypothetical protein